MGGTRYGGGVGGCPEVHRAQNEGCTGHKKQYLGSRKNFRIYYLMLPIYGWNKHQTTIGFASIWTEELGSMVDFQDYLQSLGIQNLSSPGEA